MWLPVSEAPGTCVGLRFRRKKGHVKKTQQKQNENRKEEKEKEACSQGTTDRLKLGSRRLSCLPLRCGSAFRGLRYLELQEPAAVREGELQRVRAGGGRFEPQRPPRALLPRAVSEQVPELVRWKHFAPPHAYGRNRRTAGQACVCVDFY
jgi:hypothetical protein